jgi:hypothetical protein
MTKPPRTLIATIAGVAALAFASSAAFAQAGMMRQGQGMGQGMMGSGMQQMPGTPGQGVGYPQTPCPPDQGMGPGMMGQGMQQMPGTPGQGMMDPEMMRMMMQMMNMMHGQSMPGPGMRGGGQGMGPGMMQGMPGAGMMGSQGPGMRVTPVQHLTTDDVRHFFGHWLERQDNPRLKLGKVEQADEDTIVAEIVTVDDSLVQRFKVDRHSGDVRPDTGGQEQQQSHH